MILKTGEGQNLKESVSYDIFDSKKWVNFPIDCHNVHHIYAIICIFSNHLVKRTIQWSPFIPAESEAFTQLVGGPQSQGCCDWTPAPLNSNPPYLPLPNSTSPLARCFSVQRYTKAVVVTPYYGLPVKCQTLPMFSHSICKEEIINSYSSHEETVFGRVTNYLLMSTDL